MRVVRNTSSSEDSLEIQRKAVGQTTEPVTTMGGVTILPAMTLDELEPSQSALFILTGSDDWAQGKHRQALEKAKAFLAAGVPVAAICGATAGLVLAGILDEKRHTGNIIYELQATLRHMILERGAQSN